MSKSNGKFTLTFQIKNFDKFDSAVNKLAKERCKGDRSEDAIDCAEEDIFVELEKFIRADENISVEFDPAKGTAVVLDSATVKARRKVAAAVASVPAKRKLKRK